MSLSCRRVKAVNQSGFSVGPDVRLHPEVPLVPLLRLMHLGVARLVLVLRRGRRLDDRRIHHRTLAQQQSALGQMPVDLLEDRLGQLVLLEQATELQQRRRIRHRLARQIDPDESAHGLAVVDRVLEPLIGQTEPLLQAIHAKHPRHPDRLTAHAPGARVQRFDHRLEPRPRHDAFHLGQELLAPRHALLLRELVGRETQLTKGAGSFLHRCRCYRVSRGAGGH